MSKTEEPMKINLKTFVVMIIVFSKKFSSSTSSDKNGQVLLLWEVVQGRNEEVTRLMEGDRDLVRVSRDER